MRAARQMPIEPARYLRPHRDSRCRTVRGGDASRARHAPEARSRCGCASAFPPTSIAPSYCRRFPGPRTLREERRSRCSRRASRDRTRRSARRGSRVRAPVAASPAGCSRPIKASSSGQGAHRFSGQISLNANPFRNRVRAGKSSKATIASRSLCGRVCRSSNASMPQPPSTQSWTPRATWPPRLIDSG
jgi:hypothetical protein